MLLHIETPHFSVAVSTLVSPPQQVRCQTTMDKVELDSELWNSMRVLALKTPGTLAEIVKNESDGKREGYVMDYNYTAFASGTHLKSSIKPDAVHVLFEIPLTVCSFPNTNWVHCFVEGQCEVWSPDQRSGGGSK